MKQHTIITPRYDAPTIWLHWLTAALVLALWLLGQSIDWFPRGAPRIAARSTHICLGALLAGMLLYRIGWRLTRGVRLPPVSAGSIATLAKAMQIVLYCSLLATLLLGGFNTWVRGDTLFSLFKIPAFDTQDPSLRDSVEDYHALAANLLLALAGLHALAGLIHQYVFKQDVLGRMRW